MVIECSIRKAEQAMQECIKRYGAESLEAADALRDFSSKLENYGVTQSALAVSMSEYELRKKLQGEADYQTLCALDKMADLCSALGNTEKATEFARSALKSWSDAKGEEILKARFMRRLVNLFMHDGKLQEACYMQFELYKIFLQECGADDPDTIKANERLTEMLWLI